MNPDDLLAQIMDLCGQYVQSGGDPAQIMDAVSQVAGGGGGGPMDQMGGGMPPEEPQMPMMGGEVGMPDMTGGMPLDEQQPQNFSSFGDANAALEEDIRKKIKGR
jgi:hypothetical protein